MLPSKVNCQGDDREIEDVRTGGPLKPDEQATQDQEFQEVHNFSTKSASFGHNKSEHCELTSLEEVPRFVGNVRSDARSDARSECMPLVKQKAADAGGDEPKVTF